MSDLIYMLKMSSSRVIKHNILEYSKMIVFTS